MICRAAVVMARSVVMMRVLIRPRIRRAVKEVVSFSFCTWRRTQVGSHAVPDPHQED